MTWNSGGRQRLACHLGRTTVRAVLMVISIMMIPIAPARSAKSDEDKSRIVLSLENAWNQAEARHDSRALTLLLSPSFVYTDSDGSFMNRAQWLQHVLSGAEDYSELTNESQMAHVTGDIVIVTGVYRESLRIKGRMVHRRGRFTDTWILQENHWNCVASQATLIPTQ